MALRTVLNENRLLAVFLGGRAPKSNTELHDVVFIAAPSVEAGYEALLEAWFGVPDGLHIDSWLALDVVDGYRVNLLPASEGVSAADKALFFVNIGLYRADIYGESHHNAFLVADTSAAAKARAKTFAAAQAGVSVSDLHTDCLCEIAPRIYDRGGSGGWKVCLTPTTEPCLTEFHNGYHVIPDDVVDGYIRRHKNK